MGELNRHLEGWANYFSYGYPSRAFRHVLENISVIIRDDELIVGERRNGRRLLGRQQVQHRVEVFARRMAELGELGIVVAETDYDLHLLYRIGVVRHPSLERVLQTRDVLHLAIGRREEVSRERLQPPEHHMAMAVDEARQGIVHELCAAVEFPGLADELLALLEVGKTLNSNIDLDVVLKVVVEAAQDVMDVEGASQTYVF